MNEQRKSILWSNVSPVCLLRMLRKNLWMIAATAAVFALIVSLFFSWAHTPKYQATMTYAVTSRSSSVVSSGNLVATREVAAVLTEMLRTSLIKDNIRAADARLADFDGTISASQLGESNFIIVTVTAATPETAFLALNALVEVFPDVADFISTRNVLNVMRNPSVSAYPANAVDVQQYCKIAAILGAGIMAVLLCYLSILSETIQTRTGARQLLDAPIIASVCHEHKNRTLKTLLTRSNKQVRVFAPTTSFAYTEQISAVCSQLEHEATIRQRKIFLVTGVGESEGKSTVAANVAASLALKGHQVALVDCDLRKPSVVRFFNKEYDPPLHLNKMLAQPYSRDNLRQCMVRNEQLGMYMLFPINGDDRSTELISGETMATLIQQLRVFDYVIIDSPPMGMFPDAEALADLVDASLLVVRQNYTAACDVNDAVDNLRACKSAFLGCVLNDMRDGLRFRYGYGKRYGYGSKYSYTGKYAYSSRSHNSDRRSSDNA